MDNTIKKQVKPLECIGAQELMEMQLDPPTSIVEGLFVTSSTIILAGMPKEGKSILAMKMANDISGGNDCFGHATAQVGVAYLALEDKNPRLQRRLWAMTDTANDNLKFTIHANSLKGGLIAQLENLHEEYPDIKLFIIDTFGAVRCQDREYSYSSDYGDIRQFKQFADDNDVCVVLLHHLRKREADDNELLDVSGTIGITGAVDGTYILKSKKHSATEYTFSGSTRDTEYLQMELRRKGLHWEKISEITESEAIDAETPEVIKAVLDFALNNSEGWSGTMTDLIDAADLEDKNAARLGKYLAQYRDCLREKGVKYSNTRTRDARMVHLSLVETNK